MHELIDNPIHAHGNIGTFPSPQPGSSRPTFIIGEDQTLPMVLSHYVSCPRDDAYLEFDISVLSEQGYGVMISQCPRCKSKMTLTILPSRNG